MGFRYVVDFANSPEGCCAHGHWPRDTSQLAEALPYCKFFGCQHILDIVYQQKADTFGKKKQKIDII